MWLLVGAWVTFGCKVCSCLTFGPGEVLWLINAVEEEDTWYFDHSGRLIVSLFSAVFYLSIFFFLSFPPTIYSELGGLLKYVRPFLNSISKAKAARLVRSLLDLFLDMEAATGQEVELCLECIEWAKAEKRTFLRQALEVRRGVVAGLVHGKQFVQPLVLSFSGLFGQVRTGCSYSK